MSRQRAVQNANSRNKSADIIALFSTISTHMAYYNFQYTIKISNNTPSLIRRKKRAQIHGRYLLFSLLYFVFFLICLYLAIA
jgi:hypothetical protein